jgi:arginine N-succinyltransferase
MPEYPIYIDLLPEEAKSVIGQPHHLGNPALGMLFKEGFHYENYVDIFDAGPTVHAYVENIETIKHSYQKTLSTTVFNETEAVECLVCNDSIIDFRVCQTMVHFIDKNHIALTPTMKDILRVADGDSLRVYSLNANEVT